MYEQRIRHVVRKLERAQEHGAELGALLQAFLAAKPYKVGVRRDETTRRPIYFLESVEPVPDKIALVCGDALQNLMGALDHLAYQLVCKDTNDTPPNPRWIYFPIADDEAKYNANKHGKMAGAAPGTISAIDALRPYRGGDDLLWSLYRLNNIEKHRLLLTVGSQAAGIHLGQLLSMHLSPEFAPEATAMLQSMTQFLMPADRGFPLTAGFELYIGGPDEEFNSNLQFRFQVALSEAGIYEGTPITQVVHDLTARVETVINTLGPLLREPSRYLTRDSAS
jgi:hypothetical protein